MRREILTWDADGDESTPRDGPAPSRGATSYRLGEPGALFGSWLPPGVELGDELPLSAGGVDGMVAGGVDGMAGGEADGDRSVLLGLSLTGPPLFASVHPAATPARRASAQIPVRTFVIM